jgi:beta-N-acetylhexosaminidase
VNIKNVLLIVAALLMLFAVIGCSTNSNDSVGIRGEITEIILDDGGKVAAVLVEGKVESDTVYDKARVAIAEDSVILKTNGQELEPQDLKQGIKVEVVFQGPVAESYPVQGQAKAIRVLD